MLQVSAVVKQSTELEDSPEMPKLKHCTHSNAGGHFHSADSSSVVAEVILNGRVGHLYSSHTMYTH